MRRATARRDKPADPPPPDDDPVDALMAADSPYDYVACGDGSGSGWGSAAGWGCLLWERTPEGWVELERLAGGVTSGTVNLAELAAPLFALNRIAELEIERRKAHGPRAVKVAVVSDSKWVVDTAPVTLSRRPRHAVLWAGVREAARHGVLATFLHLKRETSRANREADALSKWARLAIAGPAVRAARSVRKSAK